MAKCALCKNADPDKKGSHIVPHFLLKRIENIDGKKGRGYELGFSIQGMFTSSHFGESVLPEKLEKIYGEVTDQDIKNTRHPLIVDYLFCTDCEKRLSVIESEYSNTLKNVSEKVYESGISANLGMLFWSSVLWRMSIHGKSGVVLDDEQNEELRTLLDKFLPHKISEFDDDAMNDNDLSKNMSYKLVRCSNCQNDMPKWLLFHPDFNNPLCLLIDEFIIAFAMKSDYKDLDHFDCFGVNSIISESEENLCGNNELITPFDKKVYEKIETHLLDKIKEKYILDLSEFCDRIHVAAGGIGQEMPSDLKSQIFSDIVSGEKKIGRRYSMEELQKVVFNAMKNYQPRTL